MRIDTGVATGAEVPPYYDAMIAKIIGFGPTRAEAYARLLAALDATILAGPRSNLDFLYRLAMLSAHSGESLSTRFIERSLEQLTAAAPDKAAIEAAAVLLVARLQAAAAAARRRVSSEPASPWDAVDGFEYTGQRTLCYEVVADGQPHRVAVTSGS